ncbi:putative bifunctional diguanylate cyclase/phosphodiesterase [Candidatus Mycobacterium methanotrophicum]|uniref:Bifunctional diguanylate cyclase/phosphodiesterase n=1 Tax=Candidatus Mycobacterium methanotrophicum TaxID=2943498 RepID=A0ABY4QNJ8_9MYCO|nr:bifunctional diguanylate cyclase/phosphodiesterase [Candidatus Mycobacterium methanotrophicum]UQX12206.1 bifunctional diguanylate cyclase/phosphodiesterase [Candidatus Mycobacterium methanotrophicum]
MPRTLDQLVTAAATELMAATAYNHAAISQRVLRNLVSHFNVDNGFLRHNDHRIRATVLVAEWPPRENVPDPDPIGVVYFAEADSVFAIAENLKAPKVVRPDVGNADYQRNIEKGTGIPASSLACVPLLSGDLTIGILGFVKFGDREWLPEELSALQAIATLFAQVQARILAEERLHYLAEHDDLTGLLNRRALIECLDDRLAEGQPGPVALVFLNLDRLKAVNDHLGHKAGDRFIEAFAALLREAAGPSAIVARFGGDEFAIVPAVSMDAAAAESLAQQLQQRVHRQVAVDGEKVTRTASIGVAVGVPGRDDASDLLRRADQALLSVKSVGGNTVVAFDPEMAEKYAIRNDIELHLEGAIDRDSSALVLHYLPEFDMRTGEILGTEALIRWRHPTRGLLMPDSFLGVVESINLAGKLGRLVMRTACAQFSDWHDQGLGRDIVLSINVSPAQLVTDGFVAMVAATLDEFALDPGTVCLEVTEHVVVKDVETTRKTLAGLKEIGVRVAIDDFGTGYSALTYLKSLPVDTLKIDKEFVRDLGTDSADLAILRQVVALADAFGLGVIAEGVETAGAARALLELGCYRAQGFLLSRPLHRVAMESLLAQRRIPIKL